MLLALGMDLFMDNHITMLESVPDDYLYSLLKSSKVFVFPSHEEGWGIAVCEAMAAGLPIVAYDLAPFREFFPRHGARAVGRL